MHKTVSELNRRETSKEAALPRHFQHPEEGHPPPASIRSLLSRPSQPSGYLGIPTSFVRGWWTLFPTSETQGYFRARVDGYFPVSKYL